MKARTTSICTALCVVTAIALCARQSNAQAAPGVYADAVHPAGPPDPTKLDSIWQVDPLTGSVSITIPFTTTPAGGRGPKIPFTLHYNSASTVTLQSAGSISTQNGTQLATAITGTFSWGTGSGTGTTGPVGPWTTSGPFIYYATTLYYDQTITVPGVLTSTPYTGCTIGGPYIYTDESGAAHDMNLEYFTSNDSTSSQVQPQCTAALAESSPSSGTTDGSALATTWTQPIGDTTLKTTVNGYVTPPNVLYPDGTQFYSGLPATLAKTLGTAATGYTLEDSNGNQATFVNSGNTWTATDSLGRTAFTTTIPIGYAGQIPANTPTNPAYNVTTFGESGNSETYTVEVGTASYGSYNMPHPVGGAVGTAEISPGIQFCLAILCPQSYGIIQPRGGTLPVVSSIQLPDSTSYTFTYDTLTGNISEIVFPTGGSVSFTWAVRGDGGPSGLFTHHSTVVVSEVCTSTGSGTSNCWQYSFPSYSATSGLTSTVTAPDGSSTQYTGIPVQYAGLPLFQQGAAISWKEASRLQYSSGGTTPMKSVATTYYLSGPATGFPAQVATTLYDGPTPLQQVTQYKYDSYANVIEKDESDFNQCTAPCTPPAYPAAPSGGWLRKTFTSYVYANNSAWATAHIVNKPYQVLVTDGSGNPYSLTTYTYDQSGQIGSTPTGLSTHDDKYYGSGSALPRGNLTTESKCISGIAATFSSSSFTATCGSSWNTSYYYDLTGQLTQKVEGANLPTSPNWPATTKYTWTGPNGTYDGYDGFLTKVLHPDGNTDSYTYWQPIGAIASHTDWNGQTTGQITNYDYSDPLNRIRSVTLPSTTDGTTGNPGNGTTTYNYNDSAGDFWVQEQHLMTGSTWTSSTKYFDGLGRAVTATSAVPTTQCGDGFIQVQTAYDTMSRVSSTSNPYCSTSDPTYGITQFAYDALGRKIKTTLPDGSISAIAYAGNATLTTDPFNGTTSVQHIQQSNGLGFLTNVCEVSASSLSSISTDTPSACGLNIAGSGYLAKYTYNPLGDMLAVNQHGQSRSFTYDNLSRLLTALNPEVGTDTYAYSSFSSACSPSAGVPCARQDARGVITSYAYDSMSRLTSKSYSVASTNSTGAVSDLTSCYQYNTPITSPIAAYPDLNPKGQLTAEWQQAGSCPTTAQTTIPPGVGSIRIRGNHDAMGRVGLDSQCLTSADCTSGKGNFIYTYNLLGNPVQSNNGDFAATVGAAQVASTSGNGTAIATPSITWKTTYDVAARVSSVAVQDQPSASVFPTNTYSFAPTVLRPVAFDSFNHMTGAQLGIPNGASAAAIDIARQYDNRGRIQNETDGGETLTDAATSGYGTLTVTGSDGVQIVCTTVTNQYTTYTTCNAVPDTGTLSVSIGGFTASASYGAGTADPAIAASLASQFAASSSPVLVSYTAGTNIIAVTAKTSGTASDYPIVISNGGGYVISDPNSTLTGGVAASSYSAIQPANGVIYSYTVPQGGYAPNGNILQHVDSVMGTWNFTYDAVDRLMSATPGGSNPTEYQGKYGCWTYDSFGNRTLEAFSGVACTGTNPTPQAKAVYNQANNRIQSISGTTSASFIYDASGNTLYDGNNYYWYDAEGQLCAVQRAIGGTITQYVYDGEGARIAKGTLASAPSLGATCPSPLGSGFAHTARWLVDQGGDQVTEFDNGNWAHSNIWAGGKLTATYDTKGIHYELADPLGTKRVQANALGQVDETCTSLPFGNDVGNPIGANCGLPLGTTPPSTADDATEHHFTGKERDAESGNDYFGARYYASSMGRFMSPDWSAKTTPVPYAVFTDPQSLNLYAYVRNNPLTRVDADGHTCKSGDWGCNIWDAGAKTWNTVHQIATKVLGYGYMTGSKGTGENASLKIGPVKIEGGWKKVDQMTRYGDGKVKNEKIDEKGMEIGFGPAKVGVSRTTTQEEGQAPRTEWVPGLSWGKFEGENGQIGVGGDFCHTTCSSFQVGVQADKLLGDVYHAVGGWRNILPSTTVTETPPIF